MKLKFTVEYQSIGCEKPGGISVGQSKVHIGRRCRLAHGGKISYRNGLCLKKASRRIKRYSRR